jgi:hypothetical protein
VTSPPAATLGVVLVFGGDATVGRALELLLQSADYDVRFLGEHISSESGVLGRAQLVILAPGLSTEAREYILTLLGSRTEEAKLPVLELNTNYQDKQAGTGWFLPWPCRTEELKQQVKAALLKGFEEDKSGRGPQAPREEEEASSDKSRDRGGQR